MHPRHHRDYGPHHHHGPSFSQILKFTLMVFIFFTLFRFGGWWLFFLLPLAFGWFKGGHRHHWGHWDHWDHDGDDYEKRKNDEKPKRRVIETVDGEVLEVIESPRQV
ncbi:MAG: hypothetical protein AAF125_26855 [Chloroflexota bacterium]